MVDTLQGWHTLGTLTKDGTERPQLWRQTGRGPSLHDLGQYRATLSFGFPAYKLQRMSVTS